MDTVKGLWPNLYLIVYNLTLIIIRNNFKACYYTCAVGQLVTAAKHYSDAAPLI